MTIYKAGDIVTIPFPYVEGKKGKVRPTLLVSDCITAGHQYYYYVVMVTSKQGKEVIKGDVLIEEVGKCGLIVPSIIRCSRIATLDQKMIIGKIGKIPLEISALAGDSVRRFFNV